MKIKYAIWLIMTFLFLGACSVMKGEEKKDESTRGAASKTISEAQAVQDDYTRSFLTSTEEVEDGFYEMRTWTDEYSIWIPSEATLDKTYYQKRERYWEKFLYAWIDEKENLSYALFGWFEDSADSVENVFFSLNKFAHYEGEYDKTEDEKHIYYFGKMISQVGGDEGEEPAPVYVFLGLLKDKKSDKSLGLYYGYNCSDWTTNCNANSVQIEEHFWKIMKSVQFD